MSRSKWKGLFTRLLPIKYKIDFKKIHITRNTSINNQYIGKNLNIYNGKEFRRLFLTKEKIGLKIGNFISTTKITPKNRRT